MATPILLLLAVALLAVGALLLPRIFGSKAASLWPRFLFAIFAAIVCLFLLWLAIMVFVVGPSMH